jgi:2',3'-cyclic-nucleotide 2'-phosphodiesterase (5'-nucleotidase family)
MKKHKGFNISAAVAGLLTTGCILVAFLTFVAAPATAQSTQVTLLHISDTHSHLEAWGAKDTDLNGTLGGLPKVAAIVAAERASDPNAIFVHAGDFMDGDLFFSEYLGAAELQLLQSIGLDALVLGNHDFRLGPDFLTGVLQTAWPGGGVPILGANLDPKDHPLGSWINFTMMREVDGVKVGFFGLSPRNGALANPQPVVISKYPDPATKAVAELRAAGAQVVVCVAHIGMISSLDLAQKVPGIDIIVNGHDNAVLQEPATVVTSAGKTFIVSAGNHYRWVGRLRITVDNSKVSLFDYALLSADGAATASPAMQAKIDELKAAS